MIIFIFLLFAGAMVGILSGLLGIGGGIIVVPTLVYFFQNTLHDLVPNSLAMHMAVASSLMAIFLTSLMSAYTHYRKGSLRFDIASRWMIGLCLGAILGAVLVSHLQALWLQTVFAMYLLLLVVKFSVGHRLPKIPLPSSACFLCVAGVLIGFLSGLLGVGGGLLMIPLLMNLGCTMPEAAGTSSASMVPLSLIAGISFMITGEMQHVSAAWSTGYIYWPAVMVIGVMGILFAPLGVKLSHRLPEVWTKRLLVVLLFVIAIDMLV